VIAYSLASEDYRDGLSFFLNRIYRDIPHYDPDTDGLGEMARADDPTAQVQATNAGATDVATAMTREQLEAVMLSSMKTPIKHQFGDEHDGSHSRFLCRTSWAAQFHAMREVLCNMHGTNRNHEQDYARSLSLAENWAATGGKSGATFSKTLDNRFIVKHITKTEFQMFIDCAPAYFEYMAQVLFHGRVSVLVKVLGVHELQFQSGTGEMKRRQIIIMENLFQECNITRTFDLKGAHRQMQKKDMEDNSRVFLDDRYRVGW
jgi:1-phosphatidylinositol-3-phosphate 5-kinase